MENHTIYNPILKNRLTFIESVQSNQGNKTKLAIELAPSGGYNPTIATQEKTIKVTSGRLDIYLNGKKYVLFAQHQISIYTDDQYYLENTGPIPVKYTEEINPGCSKIESFLKINYGLVVDGLTNNKCIPKNIFHRAVLNQLNQDFIPRKNNFYNSRLILKALFKYASITGIERSLYRKYVSV